MFWPAFRSGTNTSHPDCVTVLEGEGVCLHTPLLDRNGGPLHATLRTSLRFPTLPLLPLLVVVIRPALFAHPLSAPYISTHSLCLSSDASSRNPSPPHVSAIAGGPHLFRPGQANLPASPEAAVRYVGRLTDKARRLLAKVQSVSTGATEVCRPLPQNRPPTTSLRHPPSGLNAGQWICTVGAQPLERWVFGWE